MKLKGKKIAPPKSVEIIIPRGEGEDIVFMARPIVDTKDFDKLCPEPHAVRVLKPGGVEQFDYDDATYQENMKKYNRMQFAFLIINSILATDGFEWEQVKVLDPTTWLLYEEELSQSGLTQAETGFLIRKIVEANTLDESRIKEARDRFFSKKLPT